MGLDPVVVEFLGMEEFRDPTEVGFGGKAFVPGAAVTVI